MIDWLTQEIPLWQAALIVVSVYFLVLVGCWWLTGKRRKKILRLLGL